MNEKVKSYWTGTRIALLLTIATPCLAGGSYVAKLVGDTLWLPIGSYQQEKLYELQDEAADLEAKEKYEGDLTQREAEKLKRLLKRVERLQTQLE